MKEDFAKGPRGRSLTGKKVAFLATDGFEQVELMEPRRLLEAEGAQTVLISPRTGEIQGFNHHEKGDKVAVDLTLEQAHPSDYDGLVLPGGAINPDTLRTIPEAVAFVKNFASTGKPISAICHGPWTLVEADVVRGRTVTSWPSLKTDLVNAGAKWIDREVVVDRGLVTSRKPDDIQAFVRKTIEELNEPQHQPHASAR